MAGLPSRLRAAVMVEAKLWIGSGASARHPPVIGRAVVLNPPPSHPSPAFHPASILARRECLR